MKFLKKNQVIILVIAVMLVAAGYLNYTATTPMNNTIEAAAVAEANKNEEGIGDAKLVNGGIVENTDVVSESTNVPQNNTNTQKAQSSSEIANTVTEQAANAKANSNYFTSSRLQRDSMYSQMIESYQKILDSTQAASDQKAIASEEIKKVNTDKNAIMIAENLIKTKGFNDVVIFINHESISVIVNSEKLETEQIAQIQNIVSRELNASIENIHISNK